MNDMDAHNKPVNVKLEGSFSGCASLSCDFAGAHYHVWISTVTWQLDEGAMMFKKIDGSQQVRKLPVSGALGRKIIPHMLAMLPTLKPLYERTVAEEEAQAQRSMVASALAYRIKEASPRLLASLLATAEALELAQRNSSDRIDWSKDKRLSDAQALIAELKA